MPRDESVGTRRRIQLVFSDYHGLVGGGYVATETEILPIASEAGTIAAMVGGVQAGISDPVVAAQMGAEFAAIIAAARKTA